MVDLPKLELKAERHELVKWMCAPFRHQPGYQKTKGDFTEFVNRMGHRNVLDCHAVIKE